MSSHKETFEVTVHSPLGKQAISRFEHWLNKVGDDAKARWGITISVSKKSDEEMPEDGGFNE
jgi:hypothetical protein